MPQLVTVIEVLANEGCAEIRKVIFKAKKQDS